MNRALRFGFSTAFLFASFTTLAAAPRTGDDPAPPSDLSRSAAIDLDRANLAAAEPLLPEVGEARRPAPTLPTFSGTSTVGRKRYRYTLVGTNPTARHAKNVVVPVLIVPIRLEFSDGTVLDPTEPDGCLGGGRNELDVTLQSPLFQDFDYGDGPRQFLEHTRRLEFWQYTGPHGINPGYSVRLAPTVLPKQTLALSAKSVTLDYPCDRTGGPEPLGHLDAADSGPFFAQLPTLLPKLGANPGTFVLLLFPLSTFTSSHGNGVTSFHGAISTRVGTITYAAAQLGEAEEDEVVTIGPLSREFTAWLDNPFGNNDTPVWGRLGHVPDGCVTGLEVAEPTSTFLPLVPMPNGLSYQTQETAFIWWFFGQKPSPGFDGWYSTGGTFKTPAPACH